MNVKYIRTTKQTNLQHLHWTLTTWVKATIEQTRYNSVVTSLSNSSPSSNKFGPKPRIPPSPSCNPSSSSWSLTGSFVYLGPLDWSPPPSLRLTESFMLRMPLFKVQQIERIINKLPEDEKMRAYTIKFIVGQIFERTVALSRATPPHADAWITLVFCTIWET